MDGVYALLDTVKDIQGDIRYFLCDIEDHAENEEIDLSTEDSCRAVHERFMSALKKKMGTKIMPDAGTLSVAITAPSGLGQPNESRLSSDSEEEDYVPPLLRSQTAQDWRAKRMLRKTQSSMNLQNTLQRQVSGTNHLKRQGRRSRTTMNLMDDGAEPEPLQPSMSLKRFRSMSVLRLDLDDFDISPDPSEAPLDGLVEDLSNFVFSDEYLENVKLDQIHDVPDHEEEYRE